MFVTVESVEEAFVLMRRAWSLHGHRNVPESAMRAFQLRIKCPLVLDIVVLDDDPGDGDIGVDGALNGSSKRNKQAQPRAQ